MLKKQSNKLILVMLAFLFVVALTACSEPTQTGTNDAEPTEKGVVETEKTDTAEADTRIFQAVNGEIEVPANPERVVVVASSYVGYFLALDLTPVGISEKALNNPYFAGKVEGIASVGDEISVKTILALDPDLIISFHVPESVEQLEKIAPTVAIEYGKKDLREQLRDFGTLTGREEKAEAWIAEWDKKIAEHKTKVNEAVGDQTVSILQPYAKGIYAFGHSYARGGEIIYGEFGLKAPELFKPKSLIAEKVGEIFLLKYCQNMQGIISLPVHGLVMILTQKWSIQVRFGKGYLLSRIIVSSN